MNLLIGAEKGFLHHIFGILLIAGHTKGEPEHSSAVAFHKNSERIGVSALDRGNGRVVRHLFHSPFRLPHLLPVSWIRRYNSDLAPQIFVLDAGGQYCHLIARKVRELGVSAEVRASDTPAAELSQARGLIISGGPSSVYEPGSPAIDPAILRLEGVAVLGICYGQQLMAYVEHGVVEKGEKGEYGFAQLSLSASPSALLEGLPPSQQVWMSHRDKVSQVPAGYDVVASTPTCSIAAMANASRLHYAVQFHPEVVHTRHGREILSNYLFRIAGCTQDWNPTGLIQELEEQIRRTAGDRNVFFFVSGGVDSTVAYTLCLRALGPERVWGAYVDTGLMREGETEFVGDLFRTLGATHFHVEDARDEFLAALSGAAEPEKKRHIIGQKFVDVQQRVLQSGRFLEGAWILGQGTIYPDTIESGGTAKADLIKTHHNRVPAIQKLIDENRIIEPLTQFYKDEVRAVGRQLGLPGEFLDRHPFPGPGLAIRCLCATESGAAVQTQDGWVLPIKSVGVQGDSRSYRNVLVVLEGDQQTATAIVNRRGDVNRALSVAGTHAAVEEMRARPALLTADRLQRLRRADAIVRELSHASGFDAQIWQFPVVLLPFGVDGRPDSVVLRPIQSVDGMTADAVSIPTGLLEQMVEQLKQVDGLCAIFCDLTNKPPGTIEWE
jgi:GMP synthase (glutamine-hydrolysing)